MLSKTLSVGDRIELEKLAPMSLVEPAKKIAFVSEIYEILDEDTLAIAMPIFEGKVVPLGVGTRYEACFYTSKGMYQTRIIVKQRYKEGSFFVLHVQVMEQLKKIQRRQYFRLSCTIDVQYKVLTDEAVKSFLSGEQTIVEDVGFIDGVVLDISGGGMRFTSEQPLEKDDVVLVSIIIPSGNESQNYLILGSVLRTGVIKTKEDRYEHRIEYKDLDKKVRERLIHFIFEEERRQRKRD